MLTVGFEGLEMELMDKLTLGNEEDHESEVGFSLLVRKKSRDRRKGDCDEDTQAATSAISRSMRDREREREQNKCVRPSTTTVWHTPKKKSLFVF